MSEGARNGATAGGRGRPAARPAGRPAWARTLENRPAETAGPGPDIGKPARGEAGRFFLSFFGPDVRAQTLACESLGSFWGDSNLLFIEKIQWQETPLFF